MDPNICFLPAARPGLGRHPYKVLQNESHRRRRGWAFSLRVVKYWNKVPVSFVTATSANVFKKKLAKVLAKVFPHLPHRLNTHSLIFLLPHPTCTPLINSYDLYMLPNMILVLYMWFLQGLIFTIINHSHKHFQ